MENKSRCDDLVGHVMNVEEIIADMPTEKVRMLFVELDMIMEDYKRPLAIAYLCSNYSSKKHLCSTIMNGKHDHEIKDAASLVRKLLEKELEERKKKQ